MLSKGVVKLKGWKPQRRPNPNLCKKLMELCVQAVYSKWSLSENEKASSLQEIYVFVLRRVHELKLLGVWRWGVPGKRTVDRRVNEAASKAFSTDGIPKIVSVTAGIYTVNPELLEESC